MPLYYLLNDSLSKMKLSYLEICFLLNTPKHFSKFWRNFLVYHVTVFNVFYIYLVNIFKEKPTFGLLTTNTFEVVYWCCYIHFLCFTMFIFGQLYVHIFQKLRSNIGLLVFISIPSSDHPNIDQKGFPYSIVNQR